MSEVSRQAALWVYEAGVEAGLTDEEIFRETGIDLPAFKAAKRVGWEPYAAMLDNLVAVVGIDGMREMGEQYAIKDEFRAMRRVAGLIASPHALYHFMARWAGPANNRNMRFTMEDEEGGNSIYHTVTIDERSRGSLAFLYGATGVLKVMPCLLGLPAARVDELEIRENFGAWRIHLPDSRTVGSWFRRGVRIFKGAIALPSVLFELTREVKDQSRVLTRQQEDFRGLLDRLSDGVFLLEKERILYTNEALRHRLGLCDDVDLTIRDLEEAVAPVSRENWRALQKTDAASGIEVLFEPGNQERVLLSFAEPRLVAFGSRDAVLYACRDITAEREVARRLREAANKERQRLAMSLHDGLGQHLAGIALKAQRLGRNGREDTTADEARELAELTREAIDLTRGLAQGLATSDDRPGNLQRALRRETEKSSELLGIECLLDVPAAALLTMTPVSLVELVAVVREAVNNAFRHGRSQRVVLSLQRRGARWELAIENDGLPLDSQSLCSADGLGVTSMRYRVRDLGGTIRWLSGEAGARVVINLPETCIEIQAEQTSQDVQPQGSTFEGTCPTFRVLVADDHRLVREGLVKELDASKEFEVCAETGRRDAILDLVERERPDLVLSDLLMDGRDNLDLIAELKRRHAVKVVVLSMGNAELYEQQVLAAGASAYLTKSVAVEEVMATLRAVCTSNR